MIKLFKHKTTGRYLAGFMQNKEADTTKVIDDAIKFDLKKSYRKYNYHRFIADHRDELKDFETIEIS